LPDGYHSTWGFGQVIVAYRSDELEKQGTPIVNVANCCTAVEAVKIGTPSVLLSEIVQEHYNSTPRFEFVSATLAQTGRAGLFWYVTWEALPATGGFSGTPKYYQSIVAPDGKVLQPHVFVFDACYCSGVDRWICSTLSVSEIGSSATGAELSNADVRAAARSQLLRFASKAGMEGFLVEFDHVGESEVEIPFGVARDGALTKRRIWKVEFCERGASKKNVIAVWVTNERDVGPLRFLDSGLRETDTQGSLPRNNR